ncbi:4,5-dihydroxyphthalate decarboxylase [Hoeflea sp. IMCC20628]|uniref:4,5-dihydroxyphthalate decarboxylase n=1 Tax=Hoeflea sp. IMCC20628 TaxID=1620421 RepID=UPI00063A9D6D|nr:4,5-dihydroxyphthalate decarboxylase [Hoeflea sp. IMCC20628]AKI02722.1 4,5-dihydroxyphthalate decarboxylase [Hoeflea sp. IMCC20628]
MENPNLNIVLRMQGNVAPICDGRVKVDGFDLTIHDEGAMQGAFRSMVREHKFEISELALTTYVVAREHGAEFTALPIFLVREFHHGAILFNRNAGITDPKQLEGRDVGVDRGYTVTTGVWAREILAKEHGVDPRRVNWILSSDEHVADFRPPENVRLIEDGRSLREDLQAGVLPATVGFFPEDIPEQYDNIVALHPDGLEAGLRAFDQRGHYPINHLIVVRNDVLARNPDLPVALFDAFAQSKQIYVDQLKAGAIESPTAIDQMHARILERGADPLPYGIEPNRALLEGYLEQCQAQGVLNRPVSLEALFEPTTLELIG